MNCMMIDIKPMYPIGPTSKLYKLLIGFMFNVLGVSANIVLPSVFGNGMVLQQETEVTIWGWGKPNEPVVVTPSWGTEIAKTKVDNTSVWQVKVKTPKAGGPYTIKIQGYNTIILEDILIGEVWLCSGQSNMEWSARMKINNADEEAKNADYPNIRFFTVWHRTADSPQLDIAGSGWSKCSPTTMYDYSALAYFFARKIHKDLGNVPIGLINSSWGGTPAEIWTNPQYINTDSILLSQSKKIEEMEWGPKDPGKAYYTMIEPLKKFRIAGALWYQGETNVLNGKTYDRLLAALVKNWRTDWGYDFPFYYAQIAPWKYGTPYEGVVVRDAQRRALALIANSGMVVTSDIGDIENIHPANKQEVGARFANLALKYTYKKIDTEVCGPLYQSYKVNKGEIEISFDHTDNGLVCKGSALTHFEIAGADKQYAPAIATIKGNKVVVKAKTIKEPLYVRFAWDNIAVPNLFNKEGLPASSFTTEY